MCRTLLENHYRLMLGNCNVLTLTGKEWELVEKAKKYHLDIVKVSFSTKRLGSGIVDLDGGWKLFYSVTDPSMSAQVGVGILTSPQLSDCVFDWIPLGTWACMLKLKVKDRLLCLLQLYAPNAVREYQAFVDDVNDALQRVRSTESTIFSGILTHTLEQTAKHGKAWLIDPASNENGWYLLQFYCSNGLCIMNIFFQHRDVCKHLWYRPSMAQKSLINFCIVSSDLFSKVLYVRVKREAKLSTDHYLVVCSLRFSKPWLNRKSRKFSVAYRIKWKALADRNVKKQLASSMAAKFQQLSEISDEIEMEWSLFQTLMILSAVESCGWKRLRMAAGSEKRTSWWNQDVKEAIRAKKDAFKALLQNRSSSDLQSRYSERKNLQLRQ